jgi:RNA polymerase sigma factor (sigma-70 family)
MERDSLTAERERQLLLEARGSSAPGVRHAAITELWESHCKLVVSIASRYRQANIDILDLIGAGHLGLHTAIERFEPDRFDTRLSTYAIGWIRWHIQDYITRNASDVRLPDTGGYRRLVQLSSRLIAEARRGCMRDGIEPTDSEVCLRIGRRIGLPPDEVRRSLSLLQDGLLSLHDAGTGNGGSGRTVQDTLADDTAPSENDVILRLDYAKIHARIMTLAQDVLGERERIVFLARCMTANDDIVHITDLAAKFGVSQDRVYQLEASARRKVANVLAREGYSDAAVVIEAMRLPAGRAPRRKTRGAAGNLSRGASDERVTDLMQAKARRK